MTQIRHPKDSKRSRNRRRWLGWLGLIVAIVGVALFGGLDLLMVQTNSMWPLLQGDPKEGDRILVSRFSTWFRDLERLDLVAFHHQSESSGSARFVKRLVGFEGELVEARNGDLYLDGEIYRKDRECFDQTLVEVVRWEAPSPLPSAFEFDPGRSDLSDSGLLLDTLGLAQRAEPLRFVDSVCDSGGHPVQDQRIRLRIRWLGDRGWLRIGLTLNEARIKVRLGSIGAGGGVDFQHFDPQASKVENGGGFGEFSGLEPGRDYEIELYHIDCRVGLLLDGVPMGAEYHYEPSSNPGLVTRNGPEIEVLDSKALLSSLILERDVHLRSEGLLQEGHRVSKGCVFVLGDNPVESRDSRFAEFGDIPCDDIIGRPILVWAPSTRRRIL